MHDTQDSMTANHAPIPPRYGAVPEVKELAALSPSAAGLRTRLNLWHEERAVSQLTYMTGYVHSLVLSRTRYLEIQAVA